MYSLLELAPQAKLVIWDTGKDIGRLPQAMRELEEKIAVQVLIHAATMIITWVMGMIL